MKVVQLNFIIFVFVTATGHISAGELSKENGVRVIKVRHDAWVSDPTKLSNRHRRQSETTTTPKPKKPRPSNIFSLISVLLTETREDANRAFNEIGTLFNSQFANSTTTTTTTTTTAVPPMTLPPGHTTTPSPSSSSTTESDEDNEITTTTEPFRISREEFFGILRSNVQGIVNLFGREFRVAIRDSNQNAREFGRDLGLALRPYFDRNNYNNSTNRTSSKRNT